MLLAGGRWVGGVLRGSPPRGGWRRGPVPVPSPLVGCVGRWGAKLGALWADPALPCQYMGCVEVLQSMRALDFNTRTQVTR